MPFNLQLLPKKGMDQSLGACARGRTDRVADKLSARFILLRRWQCQHQLRDDDQRCAFPFVAVGRRLPAQRVKVRRMALDLSAFGIVQDQIGGERRNRPVLAVRRRPLRFVFHRYGAQGDPCRQGWHPIQSAHVGKG